MTTGKPRLAAIVGPTAAGKTALAVQVAEQLDGEIVSVDSMQVYRRLDIGTAKPSVEEMRRAPHHLIDVVDPDAHYDAARFAVGARAALTDIASRGRAAILCGGSGLYLRALSEGLFEGPEGDPAVRARLDTDLAERGAAALHERLRTVDPAAAARIAPADAVRIRRALEVYEVSGRPLSDWHREHREAESPFDLRAWVLSPPTERLRERIAARTAAMWDEGLADEVAGLLRDGLSSELRPLQAIGYREARQFLAGELSGAEAVAAITLATQRLAKRQRTWFRSIEGATWLQAGDAAQELAGEMEAFLRS